MVCHLRTAVWGEMSNISLGKISFMGPNDQKNYPWKNLNSISKERTAYSKVLRQEVTRHVQNSERVGTAESKREELGT